ncbi:MAG: C40 family peptidase [Lachnospiraceae bacterium]|nr:C40 family peptidase [Lachnospiraceae bacterium]
MKSRIYMTAVALLAGSLTMAVPVTTWADTDTASPVLEMPMEEDDEDAAEEIAADLETEEAISQVIEAGAGESIEDEEEEIQEEEEEAAAAAVNVRQNLVNYALQFVGRPYRAGGNDPHVGADCSGFVKYVMQYGAGISMNRSSGAQASQGTAISADVMQPGDLLFYGQGSRINHVAMYIGNGQIVHASTERTGIKISKWNYRMPVRIVSMLG